MSPDSRYIEPFFGGGALFFHLELREAIINDINKPLINFYKDVRDSYPKLRKELDEIEKIYTAYRSEFDKLKALHPDERVEDKNGFDEDSHRRLAQDFANLPCKALMVIGRTPLTTELYKGYIVDEYGKNYAVNIRNRFKAAVSHIVVANYRRKWNEANVLEPGHVRISSNIQII